jgi:hypothetical protein
MLLLRIKKREIKLIKQKIYREREGNLNKIFFLFFN